MTNDRGWEKGDIVVSKPGADYLYAPRLKYLADSELDYKCFIGEDSCGYISDDWLIEEFQKEDDA